MFLMCLPTKLRMAMSRNTLTVPLLQVRLDLFERSRSKSRCHGHGDVHSEVRDEVDDDTVLVERAKILAKKPCETVLRLECTLSTSTLSLIVTAVGSFRSPHNGRDASVLEEEPRREEVRLADEGVSGGRGWST